MNRREKLQQLIELKREQRLRRQGMREQESPRPGVLARIRDFFAPSSQLDTDDDIPDDPIPLATGQTDPSRADRWGADLGWGTDAMERGRLEAYGDYRAMDVEMPEFSRALDVVSEDVTSNGRGDPVYRLRWKPGTDPRKIEAAIETERRLKLQSKVKPIVRKALQVGDAFGELSPSADGLRLATIYPRAEHTMFRVHDRVGRLKYFVQKSDSQPMDPTTFEPGQILHLRANHRWGDVYGTSMGASGRYLYRKLAIMDDSLLAMRITRSILRYAMVVDIGKINMDDWEEYLAKIEFANSRESLIDENGRLDLRAKVMDDQEGILVPATTPGVGSVSVLDGARALGNIDDVKFFWQRFLTMLPPPPAYLSIEENVNSKATLQHEGVEYAKYVRATQEMAKEIPVKVIRRDLARQGMFVADDELTAVFPVPSILDDQVASEVLRLRAQAAEILGVNVGLPMEWVIRHVLGVPDEVADDLIATMETQEPPTTPVPVPANGQAEKRRLGREVFDVLKARNNLNLISEAFALMAEYKRDDNGEIHPLSAD